MNLTLNSITDDTKGTVDVRNLSKAFPNGLSVFENISFDISSGEIVSIVGPSGSGKSTLLRCIIGLDKDFSGSININGKTNRKYLKNDRIAFVLQKYSNFKWLNVKDNVAVALHNKTMLDSERDKVVTSILKEVDLLGYENYYNNQLSGGMQQRVAVARALVQDTDIIAMDEPFGALDMKIRESLQLLIKEVNKHHKKTVLFVTHDIEEAIFLSDKIIALTKLPIKHIKIYGNEELCFKQETNPKVKYRKDFIELRQSIEDFMLNA